MGNSSFKAYDGHREKQFYFEEIEKSVIERTWAMLVSAIGFGFSCKTEVQIDSE